MKSNLSLLLQHPTIVALRLLQFLLVIVFVMRYRGYFLHDIILSHLVLLVSVPPDPGFFHREIDDSEPVVQWSDLCDMESVSEAGLRNRNPFIDDEARECSASESNFDELEDLASDNNFASSNEGEVFLESYYNSNSTTATTTIIDDSEDEQPVSKARKMAWTIDSDLE